MLVCLVTGGNEEREEIWAVCQERRLDCRTAIFRVLIQSLETCIKTNSKKMDTLTDRTLFYMSQIQVIQEVAIMPDRKAFYVSAAG
jgi:hypothetical protein